MPTAQRESQSIHVVPGCTGGWSVHAAGDLEPACVHPNATDAQRAARRIAARRGADAVVVHDRYHRLHVTPLRFASAERAAG
jgi:Uncharacterized protein conserved in bacteria (DUF2188)